MASSPDDLRPALWIGHVVLGVPDPDASKQFFLALGLRDAEPGSSIGIVELRGGTHLLLLPTTEPVAAGAEAPFDLMADDLEAFREEIVARGHDPGEIETDEYHRSFKVREPGGHLLTVSSSHATGLPV